MSDELHLQVDARCLMFFVDETGHEDFADPNYPVFGLGGCAVMAGAVDAVIKQPWRALKAEHFGSSDARLHASKLRVNAEQAEAVSAFFRTQAFGRFAVTLTSRTKLPPQLTSYQVMVGCIRRRWEELTPRFRPMPKEVAFIHEASDRGDRLVNRYFGENRVMIDGQPVKVHQGLMPKSTGDEALEVADFIVQAAGAQSLRWSKGDKRFRRDFQAVFHVNPLWASFHDVTSVEPNSIAHL